MMLSMAVILILFLSTLSLRRATGGGFLFLFSCIYFYPRSPCGERLLMLVESFSDNRHFYPRSPCGERQVLFKQSM